MYRHSPDFSIETGGVALGFCCAIFPADHLRGRNQMEDEPLSPELQEALYKNELDARLVIGFGVGMLTGYAICLSVMHWPQIKTLAASIF